jgi:hypothetical protein
MKRLLSIGMLVFASALTLWQPQPAKADVVIAIRHHHRYYYDHHYYYHRYYWNGHYYYR